MRPDSRLLFCIVVLGVLACGPASTPPTTSGEDLVARSSEKQQTMQCDAGKEHWRSQGAPVRGGVLTQSLGPTTRPHLDITDPGMTAAASTQVYRRLVRPRSCFYEDLIMEPDMAKSWEISPDGLVWTFRLREDIRWHNKPPVNGRALTAADVAWTIDLQKQRGQLRSYWEEVTHQEPDARTVVLRFKEPDADFLGKLGGTPNMIFPREVFEQHGDFKAVAIGTGPFMLKEFRNKVRKVLERNPDWVERGADGKALPYVDEMHGFFFDDGAAELAAARAGQLDFFGGQETKKADADALKRANPKLTHFPEPVGAVWGLLFNLQKPPFNDLRVRIALALAVNHEEIIAGPRQGEAIRTGFLPVVIQPYAWPVEKAREKFRYEPDRARQLLAQAGYGPGQLQVEVENQTNYSEDTEVVVAQLRAVGIDARQKSHPAGMNSAAILTSESFSGIAWGAIPGASNIADRWFGGALRTGSPQNLYRLSDPKVDALSIAQSRELDPVRRQRIMGELQDHLYEIMPFVPSNSLVYNRFYACRVKNMRPTHFNYNLEGLDEAWLDPTGC